MAISEKHVKAKIRCPEPQTKIPRDSSDFVKQMWLKPTETLRTKKKKKILFAVNGLQNVSFTCRKGRRNIL